MLENNAQKKIDAAKKAFEQAKARLEAETKKQNEKRRRFENHHKYMMGGAIVKYFPECYSFDEKEMNRIIAAAMKSEECQRIVRIIIEEASAKEQGKNSVETEDLSLIFEEGTDVFREEPYEDE